MWVTFPFFIQIFDNIALIIMESTEEADADYATWISFTQTACNYVITKVLFTRQLVMNLFGPVN